MGDGELLAYAFRKWGRQLQAHVLGEYAAVILDVPNNVALLTHDALGIAPLFYSVQSDGIRFATDVSELVDAKSRASLDYEYIADFLAFGFMINERTPYSSIKRLLPGHSVWWSDGRARDVETWNLADLAPVRRSNDREYEEQFRALIGAGVQAALDPAGVTGVGLSGGLDSSSIACVAAHGGARELAAYSVISPRWPDADEQPWMRSVVEKYDLRWHTLDVEDMLPFSSLPTGFYGEPTHAALDEAKLQAQNELLGSHGVTVMLSGEGGDTVLCASPGAVPTHLADHLFEGRPVAALRALRDWKDGSHHRRSSSFWMLRAFIEPAVRHLCRARVVGPDRRSPLPGWITPDFGRERRLRDRASRRVAPPCRQPGKQALLHALWVDGVAMAAVPKARLRFQRRNPLLYRPLVEFMCGVPWEQKLRPRCDRYLQRRALKGILPEMVRRRAGKSTGNAVLVEGLRRSRDWFAYLCDAPMLAEHGIVGADQWRLAVRQASVGHTYDDKLFLAAVAVEVWLKQLRELQARATVPAPQHA